MPEKENFNYIDEAESTKKPAESQAEQVEEIEEAKEEMEAGLHRKFDTEEDLVKDLNEKTDPI